MFTDARPINELEKQLRDRESQIATLRAEQAVLVQQLSVAQATVSDGSRSMIEWVQAHLDVQQGLARDLVLASRRLGRNRWIAFRLADGDCTFDRAIATVRLADSGAPEHEVRASLEWDLAGVGRSVSRRRRMTSRDEQRMFCDRYFVVQPSLDESVYRLSGQLPGVMGRTVEKVISDRADELRLLGEATGVASSRGQRQADALVAIAQDSLDGDGRRDAKSSPHVTVFVDARSDNTPETAAEVAFGPKVGPETLEALLCGGRIQVVALDDGEPVVATRSTRAIPPAIRAAVLHRDGGCTIGGCGSRYRLEPHHIVRRSDGGSHDMGNLTTLCWYHHHVAIHGSGYRIDPASPPHRRRLIRASHTSGPDPPT
jgi:Domain of unknown function (DUF222)/HNH endonuclease